MSLEFRVKKSSRFIGLEYSRSTTDRLRGEFYTPNDVLINVSEEEKQKAMDWLANLKDIERRNIVGCLGTALDVQEIANNFHPKNPLGFSMIAAGTTLSPPYSDIDLFMIPETFEHGTKIQYYSNLQKPLTMMGEELKGDEVESSFKQYWKGFNCIFNFSEYERGKTLEKDEKRYGKLIQMSLLANKFDFEFSRDGREGDIIWRPRLNSEQLIELNKREGTKSVVLLRSYVFDHDYSSSLEGDLSVSADDAVSAYKELVAEYTQRHHFDHIGLLNQTFKEALAIQETQEEQPTTALGLRKQLSEKSYDLLERTSQDDVYLNATPFRNYVDSLINQHVKAEFKIQ